ncbi:hypothetical protein E4U41_002401 [Claviceps citrina]|nr:hypothetical protein E4U41_002401 [Claviceps citrina]
MDDDGPQILRPVPRRPFLNPANNATPPPGDDQSRMDLSSPSFLNANFDRNESTISLTRPQSFLNLTSSTLMGIYSGAASHTRDCLVHDDEGSDTPWGTGARTPIRRPSIDEATYELMCERSHMPRAKASLGPCPRAEDAGPASSAEMAVSLVLRGTLLCVLGLGYGVLVTRLHNEHRHLPRLLDDGIMKPGNDWRYLAFWGVGGVVLGSLLPWVDTVWATLFEVASKGAPADGDKDAAPGTDWALVMRAVGAFVGIIFAIRKLAWDSTLQVSATLALVNPLLWWLIDRSKPGFVLSAAVGLTGSVLLLGVRPNVLTSAPLALAGRNGSMSLDDEASGLSGMASQEAVETGIYVLSVLFCSCLCFGNIGRRLTWNKTSGRWGGIR